MNNLNIGAGNDIKANYVNMDLVKLPGIDVVHDMNNFPYPFEDNHFDKIIAFSILEHVDDFMATMEEIYRILKPGGIIEIRVPYWNSWCRQADPTHKRGFHELTFRFFDPNSLFCSERPYYTVARFDITSEVFVLAPFSPYFSIPFVGLIRIKNKYLRKIIGLIGNTFSNIILDLEMTLKKV